VNQLAQFHHLLQLVDLLLQLGHLPTQLVLLRVGLLGRASRGLLFGRLEEGRQGSFLPLVVSLAGDAQLPGRCRGRDLARLHLQDKQGPLTGWSCRAVHARPL